MNKYQYDVDLRNYSGPSILLNQITHKERVLEIGCATGSQTKILKEHYACEVTCVEIDEYSAQEATQYCDKMIVGDISKLNLKQELGNSVFDVVVFSDVLEHLYDPIPTLKSMIPFLSDNGKILASIPNIVHGSVVFAMLNGIFDYQTTGILDNTHVRFFTKKSIINTFDESGFVVTKLLRVKKDICNSELSMPLLTDEDKYIINYLRRNNPEYDTYQFIIEARPYEMVDAGSLILNEEELNSLKKKCTRLEMQLTKLQSDYDWINKGYFNRILRKFKN